MTASGNTGNTPPDDQPLRLVWCEQLARELSLAEARLDHLGGIGIDADATCTAIVLLMLQHTPARLHRLLNAGDAYRALIAQVGADTDGRWRSELQMTLTRLRAISPKPDPV